MKSSRIRAERVTPFNSCRPSGYSPHKSSVHHLSHFCFMILNEWLLNPAETVPAAAFHAASLNCVNLYALLDKTHQNHPDPAHQTMTDSIPNLTIPLPLNKSIGMKKFNAKTFRAAAMHQLDIYFSSILSAVFLAGCQIPHSHENTNQPTRLYPPSPAPDRVVLNLTANPETSVAVNWRTSDGVHTARVQYAIATHGPELMRSEPKNRRRPSCSHWMSCVLTTINVS